jgi:hypothetical protein
MCYERKGDDSLFSSLNSASCPFSSSTFFFNRSTNACPDGMVDEKVGRLKMVESVRLEGGRPFGAMDRRMSMVRLVSKTAEVAEIVGESAAAQGERKKDENVLLASNAFALSLTSFRASTSDALTSYSSCFLASSSVVRRSRSASSNLTARSTEDGEAKPFEATEGSNASVSVSVVHGEGFGLKEGVVEGRSSWWNEEGREYTERTFRFDNSETRLEFLQLRLSRLSSRFALLEL